MIKIIYKKIEELNPFEGNPRRRTEKVLRRLVRSIREFGFVEPVVVWENSHEHGLPPNTILGGHRRLDALRWLIENENYPPPKIPCALVTISDPSRAKALNLALNRGEEFDMRGVRDWLADIVADDIDVEIAGFSQEELDALMHRDMDVHEVDGVDYDLSQLDRIKCPACGHEWYA